MRVHNHRSFDVLENRYLTGWKRDPEGRLVAMLTSMPLSLTHSGSSTATATAGEEEAAAAADVWRVKPPVQRAVGGVSSGDHLVGTGAAAAALFSAAADWVHQHHHQHHAPQPQPQQVGQSMQPTQAGYDRCCSGRVVYSPSHWVSYAVYQHLLQEHTPATLHYLHCAGCSGI